jgi:hypothetical protein
LQRAKCQGKCLDPCGEWRKLQNEELAFELVVVKSERPWYKLEDNNEMALNEYSAKLSTGLDAGIQGEVEFRTLVTYVTYLKVI